MTANLQDDRSVLELHKYRVNIIQIEHSIRILDMADLGEEQI